MKERRAAIASLGLMAVLSLLACSQHGRISAEQARRIADRRFSAWAKLLGIEAEPVPEPRFELRDSDYLFVYSCGRAVVTVIVEHTGEVADTGELKASSS